MKNEILRKIFLKIRTQRYTAEFKNDVISHVGHFTEKLEVRTNINYVPNKVLGNRSVTPRGLHELNSEPNPSTEPTQ